MGFAFSLVGGILFISGIHLLANPDSTINCNGVVTRSISCKQNYTIFSRNTPGVVSQHFTNNKLLDYINKLFSNVDVLIRNDIRTSYCDLFYSF